MGGSSFSTADWSRASSTVRDQPLHKTNVSSSLKDELNPALMKNNCRESCDSVHNPNSTAIIIGLDMTGSMSSILSQIMGKSLGTLFEYIYDRKPVSDPQVLFCGVGDEMAGDPAPFQVGQFESECGRLMTTLKDFWVDGCCGGNNDVESYDLPYFFASHMTKIDCMKKRNQKGFIFTIGDEPPPSTLSPKTVKRVFGIDIQKEISFKDLIQLTSQSYIPFHIIMSEGFHPKLNGINSVLQPWQNLLGENAIVCDDSTKLSEVITSILEIKAGKNKTDVINSWDSTTTLVVQKAVGNLPAQQSGGLVFN